MAPKLQNKFIKYFITPLFLAVGASVILSTTILYFFVYNLTNKNTSYKLIEQSDKMVMEPILQNAELVISKQFQEPINALLLAKRYFLDTCDSTNKQQFNKNYISKFVSNYALSILNINANYSLYNQKFVNGSSNIMDYGAWIIDRNINKISDMSDSTLNYLYVLTQMNPIFSSINPYSGNATKLGNSTFNLIYVTSLGYKMFYEHRFRTNSSNRYFVYTNTPNPSWCKDINGKIPTYYYFSCRPWFQEVILNYNDYNLTIAIQPPYSYSTGEVGTTTCIRFLDTLNTNFIKNNFIVICADMYISKLNKFFDYYNNLIYGYFYVMRVKNIVPMYYPRFIASGTINTLNQYEFNLNLTYYMEEYGYYSNNLVNIFQSSRDIDKNINLTGQFSIGGIIRNYSVFPVYFNVEDQSSNKGKIKTY